jgi:hypothetical protein
MPRHFSPAEIRSARPVTAPAPKEPAWFVQLTGRSALGLILLALAALTGPVVVGVALVEQLFLAQAVGRIESDPSCSAPIWQRMYGGPCLTAPAPVRQKYADENGWNTVYHVVVGLHGGGTQDVTFQHAPTLYRRIAVGHSVMVRRYAGTPVAIGVGNLDVAVGDGPLLESREKWSLVRYVGVTMTLFVLLAAALFFTVKHVRRGALPKGQDGLWI